MVDGLLSKPVEFAGGRVALDLAVEARDIEPLKPIAELANWSGGNSATAFSMSSMVMPPL